MISFTNQLVSFPIGPPKIRFSSGSYAFGGRFWYSFFVFRVCSWFWFLSVCFCFWIDFYLVLYLWPNSNPCLLSCTPKVLSCIEFSLIPCVNFVFKCDLVKFYSVCILLFVQFKSLATFERLNFHHTASTKSNWVKEVCLGFVNIS